MQSKNKTIIIVTGILLIALALIFLIVGFNKKNDQKKFEYTPLSGKEQKAISGPVAIANGNIYANGKKLSIINATDLSYAEEPTFDGYYQLSPDSKYLAVLNKITASDYSYDNQRLGQSIDIYNLVSGQKTQLIKMLNKDMISGFTWDSSGEKISFLSANYPKSSDGGDEISSFFFGSIKVNPSLTTVGVFSFFQSTIDPKLTQYDNTNVNLITAINDTVFVGTDTSLLSIGAQKTVESSGTYLGNSFYQLNQNHTKVAKADSSSLVIFDLLAKTKDIFPLKYSSGSDITNWVAFSNSGDQIAFATTQADPTWTTGTITIWLYNFKTDVYTTLATISPGHYDSSVIRGLVFSKDDKTLYFGQAEGDNDEFKDLVLSKVDLSNPNNVTLVQTLDKFNGFLLDWK